MKRLKEYLLMTVGVILLTVGVYFFKIPNGFATGGVSGIGTLLGRITPISPALYISVINLILLFIGFIFLGKSTGIRTVYCSVLFSVFTQLLDIFVPIKEPITDQPFLELAYAILLTAIGSAIMFHHQASSGGTDIIALILKKYTSLNVGKSLLIVDFIVAFSAIFIFDIKTGLFSIAGLFAKAFLVDNVIESIENCKHFMIITTKPDAINDYILNDLHHSATTNLSTGAYSHENKTVIHTVCRRAEAVKLQKKVNEIDPSAFMIITTSSEIIGRGFRGV